MYIWNAARIAFHSSFSESGLLAKSLVEDTAPEFFDRKPQTSTVYGAVGVSTRIRLSRFLVPEEVDGGDVKADVDETKHVAAIVMAASAVTHDFVEPCS